MDMYRRFILAGLDRQTFRMVEHAFRMSRGTPGAPDAAAGLGIDYSDPSYRRFNPPKFAAGSIEYAIRKSSGFTALNEALSHLYNVDAVDSSHLCVQLISSVLGMYDPPILAAIGSGSQGPNSPEASDIFLKITSVTMDVVEHSDQHYLAMMLDSAMEHANSLAMLVDRPEQVGSGS